MSRKRILNYFCILLLLGFVLHPVMSHSREVLTQEVTKSEVSPNPEVYPDGFDEFEDDRTVEPLEGLERPSNNISESLHSEQIQLANSVTDGQPEKILVIPIEFQDIKFTGSHNQTYFEGIMDQMRAYYEFNSGYIAGSKGITIEADVVAPVLSSYDMAHYGRDTGEAHDAYYGDIGNLAREAVQRLEVRGFNFQPYDTDSNGEIDHIMIIHAGDGQENSYDPNTIWSHRWYINGREYVDSVYAYTYTTLPETGTLGVFAHEFGHDVGLPDLYDTDGSANGFSNGVGKWDVMGSGSWNGSPAGTSPSNLSAWSRIQLGWATPTLVDSNALSATVTNNTGLSTILRINTHVDSLSNEYFLLEYRKQVGYDSGLLGSGVMIWHVDQGVIDTKGGKRFNDSSARLGVYPEQADGNNDLLMVINRGDGGDPFPGDTNNHNFSFVPFKFNASNIIPSSYTYIDFLNIQTNANTASADIYVQPQAPGKVTFIAPLNNSIVSDQPTFKWQIMPLTQLYTLQISTDPTFTTDISEFQLDTVDDGLSIDANGICSYTLNFSDKLDARYMYHCRILATNASSTEGNKVWSDVVDMSASSLTEPTWVDGGVPSFSTISLTWSLVPSATHYYLSVDGQEIDLGTNTTYTHSNLEYMTHHRYKVRVTTNTGASIWSSELATDTLPIYLAVDTSGVIEGQEAGSAVIIHTNWQFLSNATDSSLVRLTNLPSGITQGTMTLSDSDQTLTIQLIGNSSVDYDTNWPITVTLSASVFGFSPSSEFSLNVNLTATSEPQLTAPTGLTFSFDGSNAYKLMGSTTGMELSLDGGTSYSVITENNLGLSLTQRNSLSANNDIRIRNKATLRNSASEAFVINLNSQITPAVTRDDSANTTSGLTVQMEYSVDGGTTWTKYVNDNALPDLSQNSTLQVRVFGYGNITPGNVINLVFTTNLPEIMIHATLNQPTVEGSETGALINLVMPSVYAHYTNDLTLEDITISGLPAGVTKSSLIVNDNRDITIILTGNSTQDYDSDQQINVTIPKSKITPQPTNSLTFSVVFSATVETQLAIPSAINFSFDGVVLNKLIGSDATMQASIDGGISYFDLSVDYQLTGTQVETITATNDILIKRKATLRNPESAPLTIDILPQASPNVSRNDDSNTVSGITSDMIYSTNGGTSWQTYTGSLPDLTQSIAVLVRYPAHNQMLASNIVTLNFTPAQIIPPVDNGGGGGGGLPPSIPSVLPAKPAVVEEKTSGTQVTKDVFEKTNASGKLELIIPSNKDGKPIVFEPDVLAKLNKEEKDLIISQESISLTLPANAISDDMIKSAGAGAQLNLEMAHLNESDVFEQLGKAQSGDGKGLFSVAGLVFEFKAQLVTEQKTTAVTEFNKALSITISLEEADLSKMNLEKLGVYWFNDTTKVWEYMGGTYDATTNTITFTTGHFSIYSIFENRKTFGDIKSHWAKEDIEVLASKHIINGKSESSFAPDAMISRAEFTALIVRVLNLSESDLEEGSNKVLPDVTQDKWYYQTITLANNLGLLPDNSNVMFNPNSPITRESMVIIMAKGFGLKQGVDIFDSVDESELMKTFTDISGLNDEARSAVSFALDQGFIKGRTTSTIVPQGYLTRAEAAVVIRRLLNKVI